MIEHVYTVAHFFAGIGGKGLGASRAIATTGDHAAKFRTLGGIDFDAKACEDFEMIVGAPSLCADVHKLEPADVRAFFGDETPDLVMLSPPCKGLSGLLSSKKAAEPKYVLMNTLMERALFLIVSTWDRPPPLIFVENVPRITSRGKDMITRCKAMGMTHGYAVADGNHDCGELGNLAQHRRRYFQVWRHRKQVPQFLYEPPRREVRACGAVLGPMPMPGDVALAGPMHSVPKLSWRNWLRLAMIPAGGDWRDLPGVLVEGQKRREKFRRDPVTTWEEPAETVTGPGGSSSSNIADPRYGHTMRVTGFDQTMGTVTRSPSPSSGAGAVADPRWGSGRLGVAGWDEPAGVVTGEGFPTNGRNAVADPRVDVARVGGGRSNLDHVDRWDEPTGAVTGAKAPSSGAISVADPRVDLALTDNPGRHLNKLHVGEWSEPALTVTGTDTRVGSGAPSIADPRAAELIDLAVDSAYRGVLGVSSWDESAPTVTANGRPQSGRFSVADPRFDEGKKKNWQQVAGVTAWDKPSPTVTSGAKIHAGAFQVADPRAARLPSYRVFTLDEAIAYRDTKPDKSPPFIPVIIAADGTWHRPLTTLELAVIQSFPAILDGAPLVLAGKSHTRWREGIGNAVPPDAAEAVAVQMLRVLLVSELGMFVLDSNPIWVAPSATMKAADNG